MYGIGYLCMLERILISDIHTSRHLADRLKLLFNLQKSLSLVPVLVRCLDFSWSQA
jgi:hypothetical protein